MNSVLQTCCLLQLKSRFVLFVALFLPHGLDIWDTFTCGSYSVSSKWSLISPFLEKGVLTQMWLYQCSSRWQNTDCRDLQKKKKKGTGAFNPHLEPQLQLGYFFISDIMGKSSSPVTSDPFVSHCLWVCRVLLFSSPQPSLQLELNKPIFLYLSSSRGEPWALNLDFQNSLWAAVILGWLLESWESLRRALDY